MFLLSEIFHSWSPSFTLDFLLYSTGCIERNYIDDLYSLDLFFQQRLVLHSVVLIGLFYMVDKDLGHLSCYIIQMYTSTLTLSEGLPRVFTDTGGCLYPYLFWTHIQFVFHHTLNKKSLNGQGKSMVTVLRRKFLVQLGNLHD